MIVKDVNGVYHDLSTGQVVSEPTEKAPATPEQARKTTTGLQEVQTTGAERVTDLVKNFSWGFNAGLFALPDAAQRAIGKRLGLNEDEVFQFTRLFNRGDRGPKNIEERFVRAFGEGAASGLPITGVLAAFARSAPAIKAAEPSAGILKGVANDAISFIQKYPKAALATDLVFGAAYEGLRQAVEEGVSPDNPNKAYYKDLLPAAAFLGLPAALSYSPTLLGAKYARDKIRAASAGLGEIEKETLEGLPGMYKLPLVRVVPNVLMKNAERKLAQVFGPISESKEAQEALKQLEVALADPRVANAGFLFDAAERTMYAPLLQRKAELLQQLGPKDLETTKVRIAENQKKLDDLFNSFSPAARQPVEDAFRAAQQERQAFFESLLKQKKDMTEAEVAAVSERLGPQNLDMLNDELRGVLMANMEMGAAERRMLMDNMGLRQGMSPEGLPMPTREGGKSLFPAVNIEAAADALIKKYRIERPSLRAGIPEPIRLLENFVRSQQIAREKAVAENIDMLARKAIDDQFAGAPKQPDEETYKLTLNNVKSLFSKKGMTKKQAEAAAREMELLLKTGFRSGAKAGEIPVSTGVVGRNIFINPKQLEEDAIRLAEQTTGVDLNLPEAIDYIQAAIRFRNDALINFNAQMEKGSARVTDAQRLLNTSKAVYDDIEKLVLNSKVLDREQYDVLKSTMDSYRDQFEKSLPLLTTKKVKGGREYFLPNEKVMQTAFSNAENLRQLKSALQGAPEGESLIERGAQDWLRSKGVVDANGLVDPRKMRQVLDRNQNIVDELPDPVRLRFQDELQMADGYITRLGQLDQRRVAATDNELDSLLSKAVRPDADARLIMTNALRDPAVMRKLVDQLGKDPENLAALRRSVYEVATEGAKGGGALKTFLDTNEKSLQVLFKNTGHLQDLKTLADLQRRVNAFADVTGQIPAFESLDEQMRRTFGSGIQWLTTTAREAAVGRINPSTGALALLVRLTGSLENKLYQRIFTRALEDPEFAKAVTQVGTPEQAAKAAAELSKIGISPTSYVPKAAVPMKAELADVAKEAAREPRPAFTPAQLPETLKSPARPLPPAPPTRGTQPFETRLPTTPPAPRGPSAAQMYMSLFPNDSISSMLRAQQTQQQAVLPPPPLPGQ